MPRPSSTPMIECPRQARAAARSWPRMFAAAQAVLALNPGNPNAISVARWYRREAEDTRRALDAYVARGGKL